MTLLVQSASFCVKHALVITVSLNLVAKRRFWCKIRFTSFCGETALVMTVSLNLVPERRFWYRMRSASISVKTG